MALLPANARMSDLRVRELALSRFRVCGKALTDQA
jgi:hypothetical protein